MSGNIYSAIAALIGFAVTAVLGFVMVPFLHKLKFGQTIREDGPKWHASKQGTPTMGGLMFIVGICVAVAIILPIYVAKAGNVSTLNIVKIVAGLIMSLAMGFTGFLDDFISIRKHRNLGLTEKQKLVLQFAIVIAYLVSIRLAGGTTEISVPFVGAVNLGFFYYIISAIFIVGMINAVNFTDGIDGLNSTVTAAVCVCFMVTAFALSNIGYAIFSSAVAGACIGFLVWNFHPAKVFMGDTGSLFLGAIVCSIAYGMGLPLLLLLYGIVYIVEIVSVVLQVTYFKATHGKRLFKMSPIHHHFELCGWSEVKICAVFGTVALVAGIICILLVAFGLR